MPFAPTQQYVLLDLLTFDGVRDAVSAALHQLTPQLTDMLKLSDSLSDDTSIMFTPVLAGGSLVGFTGVIFSWADMAFSGLLDSGARGVLGEVRSPRGLTQMFRLLSEGRLEEGDAFSRDSQFDRYRVDLAGFFGAEWRVSLWPTAELYDAYVTQTPVICAVVVALLVLFVCCIFGVYDYLAATRAELLKRMWHATEAVVADVFPNAVKSRLVQEQLRRHRITSSGHSGSVKPSASNSKRRPAVRSGKTKPMRRMFNQAAQAVSSALSRDDDDDDDDGAAYGGFIADAYAAATVVFADIVCRHSVAMCAAISCADTLPAMRRLGSRSGARRCRRRRCSACWRLCSASSTRSRSRWACSRWRPSATATWPAAAARTRTRTTRRAPRTLRSASRTASSARARRRASRTSAAAWDCTPAPSWRACCAPRSTASSSSVRCCAALHPPTASSNCLSG